MAVPQQRQSDKSAAGAHISKTARLLSQTGGCIAIKFVGALGLTL
jgi:hypothetical protein